MKATLLVLSHVSVISSSCMVLMLLRIEVRRHLELARVSSGLSSTMGSRMLLNGSLSIGSSVRRVSMSSCGALSVNQETVVCMVAIARYLTLEAIAADILVI